ncbi:hypothetical protein KJA14_01480 [Patescibacteria group bacterium]|nr:hypothetical protein [Patescibacteria group bacterium]
MKKIIVISLVLIFIILIALTLVLKPKAPPKAEISPEVPEITQPKVLYNLAGSIEKIEFLKDSLVLEATIIQIDETGQPIQKTEIRKVIVTPFTKFSHLTFVETEPNRRTPQEASITFKDLKTGDYIEVVSNQDISQAEEFEAIKIRVLPKSF